MTADISVVTKEEGIPSRRNRLHAGRSPRAKIRNTKTLGATAKEVQKGSLIDEVQPAAKKRPLEETDNNGALPLADPHKAGLSDIASRLQEYLLKVKSLEESKFELQEKLEEANSERATLESKLQEAREQSCAVNKIEADAAQIADEENIASLKAQLKQANQELDGAHKKWTQQKEVQIQAVTEEMQTKYELEREQLCKEFEQKREELKRFEDELTATQDKLLNQAETLKNSNKRQRMCPLAFSGCDLTTGCIEVVNWSVADISLAGWSVASQALGHQMEFPPEAMLASGSNATIWWQQSDQNRHQPDANSFHWASCGSTDNPWCSAGDSAILLDPEGGIADSKSVIATLQGNSQQALLSQDSEMLFENEDAILLSGSSTKRSNSQCCMM